MKTIGVFFGSPSPEHDISIITAMRVMEGFVALKEKFRPVPAYLDRNGRWFSGEALGEIAFFRKSRLGERLRPYAVSSVSIGGGELVLHPVRRGWWGSARSVRLDLAFPCFHGSLGEDGTIQGLFEIAGIPYVGCGVLASTLAMSKIHSRRLFRDAGIPGVPTHEVLRESFATNRPAVLRGISAQHPYPLFVKPNTLGSSIAVTRVTNDQELEWALELVFQFDTLALVEPAVSNAREVNVAVIGHRELTVSETEEPLFRSEYQTFEAKYLGKGGGTVAQSKPKGKAKSRIPAELPPAVTQELKGAAVQAFRLLGASGIARFDFLVNGTTNEWYLGEVNTLPGTLHAHLWAASGISLPELIRQLIGFAEERQGEERSLLRSFESSVLQE